MTTLLEALLACDMAKLDGEEVDRVGVGYCRLTSGAVLYIDVDQRFNLDNPVAFDEDGDEVEVALYMQRLMTKDDLP